MSKSLRAREGDQVGSHTSTNRRLSTTQDSKTGGERGTTGNALAVQSVARIKSIRCIARISTRDKARPLPQLPKPVHGGTQARCGVAGRSFASSPTNRRGADDDRPGWSELIFEARDRRNQRFDGVVLNSTSRLSRDACRRGSLNASFASSASQSSTRTRAPTRPRPRAN